jgi:hypothetical protein
LVEVEVFFFFEPEVLVVDSLDIEPDFVVPPAFMLADFVVLVEPVLVDVSVLVAHDVMSAAPARSAIVEMMDLFIGSRVVGLTSGRLSIRLPPCKNILTTGTYLYSTAPARREAITASRPTR